MFKRLIASLVCLTFIFSNLQYVQAQDFSIDQLPVPGTMVGVSVPFEPLALKGLIVNPQKPLEFQFIVDTGDSLALRGEGKGGANQEQVKQQANQLVKYFLAGLTIPDGDLWVNLSPYEKDRIVPAALGQTDLGRDLLAQDYILKQLTASLIYPEKDLGKEFWSRVYAKAQQQFGTTNVPVNTFNKVWILPNEAQVFENGNAAYVTKSTLKVMLDEDYLATQKHMSLQGVEGDEAISITGTHSLASQIVRQIILPEIEKEVNTGKNFAPLRQIYQALILAKWYKETIRNGLLDAVYTNKNKVAGVNLNDPAVKQQIYQRYLKAYRKGVFNYIKEDPTPDGQVMPKKYFSGGITKLEPDRIDRSGKQTDVKGDGAMLGVKVDLQKSGDMAMGAENEGKSQPPLRDGLYDNEVVGNYRWCEVDVEGSLAIYSDSFSDEEKYDFYYGNKSPPSFFKEWKWVKDSAMLQAQFLYQRVGLSPLLNPLNLKMSENTVAANDTVRWIESHPMFTAGLSKAEIDINAAMLSSFINWISSDHFIIGVTAGFVLGAGISLIRNKYVRFFASTIALILLVDPGLKYMTAFYGDDTTAISIIPRAWVGIMLAGVLTRWTFSILESDHWEPKRNLLREERWEATDFQDYLINSYIATLSPEVRPNVVKKLEELKVKKLKKYSLSEEDVKKVNGILRALGADENAIIKAYISALKFYDHSSKHVEYNYISDFLFQSNHPAGRWVYIEVKRRIEGHFESTAVNDNYDWSQGHIEKEWVSERYDSSWKKVKRPDSAMSQASAQKMTNDKASIAENGGIDLNQINVKRNGKIVNVQFDPAQISALMQGGFKGFTPVIISITSIQSPLSLLGINPAK